MTNLKNLRDNDEEQKTAYYWSLVRNAVRGPNSESFLKKI